MLSSTRKVAQFSEFLGIMALNNGEEISYQSIAGDCGVSPNSIKNYIQVLEDTLVAFQIKAFTKTRKRKAISRSTLYFLDKGNIQNFATVSCDRYERRTQDNITIFPWKLLLEKRWNGDII
jgi:predicted AAA+ superfamily ATPase